jgi:hypothetical protein
MGQGLGLLSSLPRAKKAVACCDCWNSKLQPDWRAMKKTDWELAAQDKSVAVSAYMEMLTRETVTL